MENRLRTLRPPAAASLATLCVLAVASCHSGKSSGSGNQGVPHTIGGSVSGLSGSLVLQNNGTDNLTVMASGAFTFSASVTQGATYAVTVLTQPTGQTCVLTNATGTANANITNVGVTCTTNTYAVGGSVAGLSGALVLQNNGDDDESVSSDGAFAFATTIAHGGAYAITVLTQPAGQTCAVANGSGTATAAVTNVAVTCTTNPGAPPTPWLGLVTQAVDVFRFVWPDVAGETEYRLLEDPDSLSGYTEIATIPADTGSYELVASLPHRINARYILQACNGFGCTDSNVVNVTGNLAGAAGYFKAHNTGAGDSFGVSASLSADGNTLVVGAFGEDSNAASVNGNPLDNGVPEAGAAYVFVRSGSTWSQQAYLKASNTGASPAGNITGATVGDKFGYAVAVSGDGDTIAVGAYAEDSAATGIDGDGASNTAVDAGAVYVFARNGSDWTQQAYIKASNTGADDWFGYAVALSTDGDTLAIGALNESSNAVDVGGDEANDSLPHSGAAYVFARSGGTWAQQAYAKASNTGREDSFGSAVALSGDGNVLVVTARLQQGLAPNNNTYRAGAAYAFLRSGTAWSPHSIIKPGMPGKEDYFGVSVALSADGQTLAVGAYGESSASNTVYGDESDNSATNAGAAYVYLHVGPVWTQQAYIKPSNAAAQDLFGISVALSANGDTLAVGSFFEDGLDGGLGGNPASDVDANGNLGAAYLFERSGGVWSETAYVKASNPENQDHFGYAVALSSDGSQLVVGAPEEDSNATGIDGLQSDNTAGGAGAVYMY